MSTKFILPLCKFYSKSDSGKKVILAEYISIFPTERKRLEMGDFEEVAGLEKILSNCKASEIS
jgi:hypothetical protein